MHREANEAWLTCLRPLYRAEGVQHAALRDGDAGQACDVHARIALIALERAQRCARGPVPKTQRPIKAAASHYLSVPTHGHAPYSACLSFQGRGQLPAVDVPDPHRTIESTTGTQLPIGADSHPPNAASVSFQRHHDAPAPAVPHPNPP